MRPLVIGEGELAKLARVKAHAEAHFFTLDAVKTAAASGESPCMDRGFRCILPVGFRVAFSIEQHPGGWVRHLSVSVADAPEGMLPTTLAVQAIGRELGMRLDTFEWPTVAYFEGDPPIALSVIEPLTMPAAESGTV